eukprot:CAMPEP_0116892604 /NCGR_PEP_ID=MMETSP0467-20121206/2783_1 /TAXON_ID=283647 /ORGANISM="Mesodinium pulex, Strain SPMC105" /LENGTH=115 /DNA_ID=CAMNT_0004561811 /DNA_START=782 /DNA_END=1129 /DNA_ORIENTATION=+
MTEEYNDLVITMLDHKSGIRPDFFKLIKDSVFCQNWLREKLRIVEDNIIFLQNLIANEEFFEHFQVLLSPVMKLFEKVAKSLGTNKEIMTLKEDYEKRMQVAEREIENKKKEVEA